MALIVEDGSIVPGANTYITDQELTDYADARGLTYPATAPDREQLLIKAMDYLHDQKYKGNRTNPEKQILDWPRSNVFSNERYIDHDEIPYELKNAQAEAALAEQTQSLLVNNTEQNVTKEKLDTLEVEYANGGSWETQRLERVDAYLKDLVRRGNNGLMTSRA